MRKNEIITFEHARPINVSVHRAHRNADMTADELIALNLIFLTLHRSVTFRVRRFPGTRRLYG